MKKEKIMLSFGATLIGLAVAGAAFYFYEVSKTIPESSVKKIAIASPTPTATQSIFLTLDTPNDEEVFTKKVVAISGKTTPNAIISIISQNHQDVIAPSSNGSFSTTVNITDGQNLIEISAILPNGESAKNMLTLTYSTEEF